MVAAVVAAEVDAAAETAAAGDVVFERDVGPVLEMLVEGV